MVNNTLAPRQRPVGVTIIAILQAIGGVLEILGGIFLLNVSTVAAIIPIVLGIIALVLAWGLWTLKPWAFWVTVVLEAINLISGIISLVTGNVSAAAVIQTIIALAVLIYLFADRNVRAAFRT
ncbi:DUF2127 domain-containing protein [Dictyobacter aurantiacus]|uniref:Integral membrane protein n=1 Tax=Dictyobacter aurantiacus TaxID=1936993 RepID=A0A401ZJM6_9CHLR|nr:DUF2127 domain-containing protein [Dictyobacter aurantiacus]GCE07067.1 hypothetical protein KDAU_43960 [Dictyobacter aurantiacus]